MTTALEPTCWAMQPGATHDYVDSQGSVLHPHSKLGWGAAGCAVMKRICKEVSAGSTGQPMSMGGGRLPGRLGRLPGRHAVRGRLGRQQRRTHAMHSATSCEAFLKLLGRHRRRGQLMVMGWFHAACWQHK